MTERAWCKRCQRQWTHSVYVAGCFTAYRCRRCSRWVRYRFPA